MFYGVIIKPGQEVFPEFSKGKSVLHISRACLNNPKDDGNVYLQIEGNEGWLNVCCLKKGICEDATLDLFFMEEDKKKFRINGGKSEVHLVGYYEFSLDNEYMDDDAIMDYDDSKFGNFQNKKKKAISNGKLKKNFSDDDETNAGDDEEEDEKEDDEDDDEDDEEEDDEEEDEEEEDEDDEDEEDEDEDDDDEDEDDEDEDDDDDKEEEEEEEEEDGNEEEDEDNDDEEDDEEEKPPKKKEQGKKNKNATTPNKKRPLENKGEQTTKKSKSDAEEVFEKSIIAYLKQHGKCKLPELGKIKKPENFKTKLSVFIKSRPDVFKLDKNGDTVRLAAN